MVRGCVFVCFFGTMLLLEAFKVEIFVKLENRRLAYVQMRYQLQPRRQSIGCDPDRANLS